MGFCWLGVVFPRPDSEVDELIAQFDTTKDPASIDVEDLRYAVAGRSDTTTDPPYFVFAAGRPKRDEETALVRYLLFGGAGFHDFTIAEDITAYEHSTVAGKEVYIGTADMLDQDEHQRGRPYLYQTEADLFLIVTDDDDWAAEALDRLP